MKRYIILFLLPFATMLFAGFNVGDTLPKITLPDQFEKKHQIDAKDKLLILTFDMDVSKGVKKFLELQGKDFLVKNHAKYISDISKMPSLITKWVALPKMKKYPFSIMLIYDELGKEFSQKKGKITIYKISNYKVLSVEFIEPDKLSTLF